MKGSIRFGAGMGLLLVAGMSADVSDVLSVCVMAFIGGLLVMSGIKAYRATGGTDDFF